MDNTDPQYPNGKLNEHDEGALNMAIGFDDTGVIIVDFGKPVVWFGLPPDQARGLAQLLTQRANEADAYMRSKSCQPPN